jgi:hypothetical protein
MDMLAAPIVFSAKLIEKQPQILRLTTPKLKNAWGPVRSG